MCTHCNIQGHTIDRCYKIHGYPPGYRSNQKSNSLSSLSAEQCQGLLVILQSHLAKAKSDYESLSGTSHVAGISSAPFPSSDCWVLDSGASTHICFSRKLF